MPPAITKGDTMSEYDGITELRLKWAPQQDAEEEETCTLPVNTLTTLQMRQSKLSTTEIDGVNYQRCGGGVRIIRKHIGGN